jgi:hypothetical protein
VSQCSFGCGKCMSQEMAEQMSHDSMVNAISGQVLSPSTAEEEATTAKEANIA